MKRLIIPIVLTFVAIVILKVITPQPLDWTPSFSKDDKIPLGNLVLYETLPDIFPNTTISTATRTPYEELLSRWDVKGNNYIIINRQFNPDKESIDILLDFVERGNSLFVAASNFDEKFLDTLKVTGSYTYSSDSIGANLVNPAFARDTIKAPLSMMWDCFSKFDSTNTTVLGVSYPEHKANFIKINIGKGSVYLHSSPYLFSNYYVLSAKHRPYVYRALSYLPVQNTIWDEYYKYGIRESYSTLRVVLNDARLNTAYYLIIIGVTIYVLFNGKRRQRIIPIIKPYVNATVEFVTTVGRLYFQHRDSTHIIEKKILYFNDFLRSRFYLRDVRYGNELYQKIASKSGIAIEEVQNLFGFLQQMQNRLAHSDEDVIRVNTAIEEFKAKLP